MDRFNHFKEQFINKLIHELGCGCYGLYYNRVHGARVYQLSIHCKDTFVIVCTIDAAFFKFNLIFSFNTSIQRHALMHTTFQFKYYFDFFSKWWVCEGFLTEQQTIYIISISIIPSTQKPISGGTSPEKIKYSNSRRIRKKWM